MKFHNKLCTKNSNRFLECFIVFFSGSQFSTLFIRRFMSSLRNNCVMDEKCTRQDL